jgi:hypothetical protein
VRVLYSADYELFLGHNFLPEREVLLEPTAALLEACDDLGIALTLFADVACLWRYREDGDEAFPEAVEEQLRNAMRRGHDVQAHLHPHWLHATRRDGRWSAPLDTFLVGALDDPGDLLQRVRTYLEELLQPVDPAYRCFAFRAGNYGIQPRVEQVFAALRDTGFVIDSSVVPGLVLENAVNRVDFRGFSERDGELHGLYEVPIPTARFGPLDAVRRRLRRRAPLQRRGTTIQTEAGARPSLRSRLFRLDLLELGPDARRLRAITRRYLRRVGTDVTFSFSCHPKTVGPRELDALRAYHEWLVTTYDVRAVSFRQLDYVTVYRHEPVVA